jgi:deoxyinosine 3'endonuclease (endonuclease V)
VILAVDVSYNDTGFVANAVVFDKWTARRQKNAYSLIGSEIPAPYTSGNFALREMPIILQILGKVTESVHIVVIDGYVDLQDKPGMGRILWETLDRKVIVVGVAKTPFSGAVALEIERKGKPLYISAAGMGLEDAATRIRSMHGKQRIPAILKKVDRPTPLVPKVSPLLPLEVDVASSGLQFLQIT